MGDIFSLPSAAGVGCAIAGMMLLVACQAPVDSPARAAIGQISCAPRTGGAAGLPDEWREFAPEIDECLVSGVDGAVALRLIAVSGQRFYAGKPDGTVTVPMPKPLILAATGAPVGRLAYNYPDDPPFASKLSFKDWRGGIPRQIVIAVKDPTVTGDHALVMNWDDAKRAYVGGTEK
jgi:hypothetical protein